MSDDFVKPIVLVADDTLHNLQYLGGIIEECGYEPILATNGSQVLEFVKTDKPDIILLDVIMPDIEGFEVCRILKSNDETKDIPIIFITAKNNIEDIVEGFDAGGVDYITKPFNSKELISRLKIHVELKVSKDILKRNAEELERVNIELKTMMQDLETASRTDYLTGLANRRFLFERLNVEVVRFKRRKEPFVIVLADLDHFKKINDTYGHDCGDYVLKSVASILEDSFREQDTIARWGGEEFLLLLLETNIEAIKLVISRVQEKINKFDFIYGTEGTKLNVSFTYGISIYDGSQDIEAVIKNADHALYIGKERGRNCAIAFGE